jgi:aldehyde:ferredoxin oxidoreductase
MPDGCWVGCSLSCCKAVDNFELKTGPFKGDKVIVDGPNMKMLPALALTAVFSMLTT